MKKVLVLNGSPRKNGNTSALIQNFIEGAKQNTLNIEEIFVSDLNLEYCKGCLRCNLIKRCSISNDDWTELSQKILKADVLVFGSPIYFHHVTAQLKKVIDRFRSFVHVQITEEGLKHTSHQTWEKEFVLLLPLGSSSTDDAKPVIELFESLIQMLGNTNKLHHILATRLAVNRQILMNKTELEVLYPKLNLPVQLAKNDAIINNDILRKCSSLGENLTS
jgi:FMN-dependent NADH-azoreductase